MSDVNLLVLEELNSICIRDKLVNFFKNNPNPEDSKIHNLADKLKINPHELEDEVYKLVSSLLKNVGKHQHIPIEKFDSNQIKMGLDIEKEHTDDPAIALQIAKDHLFEIPDYYTRLKAMEQSAGKKGE